MLTKIKKTYNEYPDAFKTLVLASFIDNLGGAILYPFFSLYITSHFGVGMIEVGYLFMIFAAGGIIGSMIGGAVADKYGRRMIILFGLITSGIGSIFMGLVHDLNIFYIFAAFLGLFGEIGSPSRQAMVADLLPKEKHTEGYGAIRWAQNLSVTIGPGIGGLLASYSFLILFILDAISSLITGIIVFIIIPETKPQKKVDEPEESLNETLKGYKEVLSDKKYILFLLISMITVLVYMQMESTLPIFLRDFHGFPDQGYGLLLSMNALMVVLFQFWITKKISNYSPMRMIAFGSIFLMIGLGMYGFISEIYLFFIAMAILTIGEMIVFPLGYVVTALFADEDKLGRYMAVNGFQWAIPHLFGILAAGIIIETIGPYWLWYLAGIFSLIAIMGFLLLHKITKERFSQEKETQKIIYSL